MKHFKEHINSLYVKDEYIAKNPSLHEEDSSWKISKILPLIDKIIKLINKAEINILDVGGGKGLILRDLADNIYHDYKVKVNKFALDLSQSMLSIQKKNNPDMISILNEDICKTSINSKAIDLVLMIDVLEHIYNPVLALIEISRISEFAILKVPLEDNLYFKMSNIINKGETKRYSIEELGHINFYNYSKLKNELESYTGYIFDITFTNVFDYYLNSDFYNNSMTMKKKIINRLAECVFKASPKLCSVLFRDFVLALVRCY